MPEGLPENRPEKNTPKVNPTIERAVVAEGINLETPIPRWENAITQLATSNPAPNLIKNIRIENGRVCLQIADTNRSFAATPKFQNGLIAAMADQQATSGINFILNHLHRIGRYTESEHGNMENFARSQKAISDYLNPQPTPEPAQEPAVVQEAPRAEAPKTSLEIPPAFATTGFAEVLRETNFDGRIVIERLTGNGGRPVALLIPKGFDPDKPAKVLVHFHGTYSDKIANNGFKAKEKDHTVTAKSRFTQFTQQAMAATDENIIFAYPISAGKSRAAKGKDYDGNWMSSRKTDDNFDLLIKSIENNIGLANEPEVMVSGHSAGGKVMQNLAESGVDRKISRYIFLDASYGNGTSNWAAILADKMAAGNVPKGEIQVFLEKNNYPNSAYVHTLPLEADLKAKGVKIETNRTKHKYMIATHLLNAVKAPQATIVASR